MMKGSLLSRLSAKGNPKLSWKSKSGFGTVISSVILVAAVAILGSVVLIWANSSLNVQHERISKDYDTNSNLLRETFIVEDIWLSKPLSGNYVNITLRNIGDIAINATQVNVTAIDGSGAKACLDTTSPPCTKTITSNKVIQSKQTLMIAVENINLNHASSKSLDITITTQRGSVETILWKVKS